MGGLVEKQKDGGMNIFQKSSKNKKRGNRIISHNGEDETKNKYCVYDWWN